MHTRTTLYCLTGTLLLACGAAHAKDDVFKAGRQAYERGRPEAERLLREALRLDPDHGEAHLLVADLLLQRKELDKALGHAQQAVAAIGSEVSVSHEVLGRIQLARGDLDDAAVAFERTLELDPRSCPAHCGLGRIALARRQPQKAEEAFRTAARCDRRDPEPMQLLGGLLLELERFAQAEAALTRALKLDPKSVEIQTELAFALWGVGKLDEAAARYRRLARKVPSSELLYSLAVVEHQRDQAGDAAKALRRALRLDPTLKDAWLLLGQIYREAGEDEAAKACLERATALRGRRD